MPSDRTRKSPKGSNCLKCLRVRSKNALDCDWGVDSGRENLQLRLRVCERQTEVLEMSIHFGGLDLMSYGFFSIKDTSPNPDPIGDHLQHPRRHCLRALTLGQDTQVSDAGTVMDIFFGRVDSASHWPRPRLGKKRSFTKHDCTNFGTRYAKEIRLKYKTLVVH